MKTCFLKPENREIFALEILAKIPKKWGLYRPNRKLAVRLIWQPDRPVVDLPGRPPTVINMTVGQTGRPPGQPPRYREQSSLVRSTAWSTGPCVCQTCTRLCTSVDRTVDRTRSRSTGRSTDVHRSVHVAWHLGRSTGRSTGMPQRSYLGPLAVDRAVDRRPVRLTDQPTASFWFWPI